jgi:hypothetical protein
MSLNLFPNDFGREMTPAPDVPAFAELPHHLDLLPDGREALVIGYVERFKDFNHLQGDNRLGFQNTCGIVSCEDVLRQFGVEVTESQLVEYAVRGGLCNTDGSPSECGGTTIFDQVQILNDWGVPATAEQSGSLEGLASQVEEGRGVIAGVNAGVLWDRTEFYENNSMNHAIVITGVARAPQTREVLGFFINDSGKPESGRFIDAPTMQQAFIEAGGMSVSTVQTHGAASTDG